MTTPRDEIRTVILERAAQLVSENREEQYGSPHDNLSATAKLIESYLIAKFRGATVDEKQFEITAEDVAWINVLQKIGRCITGKVVVRDNYIDAAGYAALAGELREADNFK